MTEFEKLIALAREHRPGEEFAAAFGFETRLLARLRELRETGGEPGGFSAVFSNWLWRTSWGLTPVVTALAIFLVLSHGLALPEGAGDLVHRFTSLLPVVPF